MKPKYLIKITSNSRYVLDEHYNNLKPYDILNYRGMIRDEVGLLLGYSSNMICVDKYRKFINPKNIEYIMHFDEIKNDDLKESVLKFNPDEEC